jgi:ABC-2 type transport system ATP-binding protein
MSQVIEITELTKEFTPLKNLHDLILEPFKKQKPFLAIDNINLQIREGEIFSLIGPNGAGKTTIIKILSCLILPTKGTVKVMGYDILKDEEKIKSSIGLVSPDERSFYWRLTLRENLYFFAELYNLSSLQMKRKIEELGGLLEINDYFDKRFQECSSGIKQRLVIVRSLINNPKLLFMDEPFKSLDPLSAKKLKNIIKKKLVEEQGKTILFVSHNLNEVVDFSDRIAIMRKGKILTSGTLEELCGSVNSSSAILEDVYEKIINI